MYNVLGYTSALDIDNGCAAEQEADTLKEAKRIAQVWRTTIGIDHIERVIVKDANNECVLDIY